MPNRPVVSGILSCFFLMLTAYGRQAPQAAAAPAGEDLIARYAKLRAAGLDANRIAVADNVTFEKGTANFRLIRGSVYFMEPVEGQVPGCVFLGEGVFELTPPSEIEKKQLSRLAGGDGTAKESFSELVVFAEDAAARMAGTSEAKPGAIAPRASGALADLRNAFRNDLRTNIDARALASLLDPQNGMFLADMKTAKHGSLLFVVDQQSEEEVQLFHRDSSGLQLWTQFPLPGGRTPEQRWLADTVRTRIDATVDKAKKLAGSAEIEFVAQASGARLLNVHLAPTLRVSKVDCGSGGAKFIQEDKKKDADLWFVLGTPLVKGERYVCKVEYAGDGVISSAGSGNFYVGRRSNWYPRLDVPASIFRDRGMYQLRFTAPKDVTLVATGKLVKESSEGKSNVSEWETEVPYPVAGFNYGKFKVKSQREGNVELSVYANIALNDEMQEIKTLVEMNPAAARELGIVGGFSTTNVMDRALAQSVNSVRVFSNYFGSTPFSRIAITQQPSGSFGQSWPTLVFMPYTAFLDAGVRHQLRLDHDASSRRFLEEVGPHEIAHQWWGHVVGPKTYHDLWLEEGFAEYSAGIYTHRVSGPKDFGSYIDAKRQTILSAGAGTTMRLNDAGPISLGFRLSSEKMQNGGQLVYEKGAYVLHMLRMMMFDYTRSDDSHFINMMRDFVATYGGKDASTEDFQQIVSKHFGQDMSWFFRQWVYGTEVPKITVEYSLAPNEKGVVLKGTIRQRDVSPSFKSVLPAIIRLGGGAGSVKLFASGESTPFSVQLPKQPDSVEFNPFRALLCDLDVKKL